MSLAENSEMNSPSQESTHEISSSTKDSKKTAQKGGSKSSTPGSSKLQSLKGLSRGRVPVVAKRDTKFAAPAPVRAPFNGKQNAKPAVPAPVRAPFNAKQHVKPVAPASVQGSFGARQDAKTKFPARVGGRTTIEPNNKPNSPKNQKESAQTKKVEKPIPKNANASTSKVQNKIGTSEDKKKPAKINRPENSVLDKARGISQQKPNILSPAAHSKPQTQIMSLRKPSEFSPSVSSDIKTPGKIPIPLNGFIRAHQNFNHPLTPKIAANPTESNEKPFTPTRLTAPPREEVVDSMYQLFQRTHGPLPSTLKIPFHSLLLIILFKFHQDGKSARKIHSDLISQETFVSLSFIQDVVGAATSPGALPGLIGSEAQAKERIGEWMQMLEFILQLITKGTTEKNIVGLCVLNGYSVSEAFVKEFATFRNIHSG